MTARDTKTPGPRRKALLIGGAFALLLGALTAFHIPQWAYSEIQASIAQNYAQTQDVGHTPSDHPQQFPTLSAVDQTAQISRLSQLKVYVLDQRGNRTGNTVSFIQVGSQRRGACNPALPFGDDSAPTDLETRAVRDVPCINPNSEPNLVSAANN